MIFSSLQSLNAIHMAVETFIWFGGDDMIEIINVRPIRGKSNEDIAKELIKND